MMLSPASSVSYHSPTTLSDAPEDAAALSAGVCSAEAGVSEAAGASEATGSLTAGSDAVALGDAALVQAAKLRTAAADVAIKIIFFIMVFYLLCRWLYRFFVNIIHEQAEILHVLKKILFIVIFFLALGKE